MVSDLLFDCKRLISYLSSGTTLQKGSVIMTGTPGGKSTIIVAVSILILIRCWGWNEPSKISSSRYKDGSEDIEDWNAEKYG